MKSLQEHLMENLNEGAQFWELNERTHTATYRFNFDKCDRITKERFNEIGMDVSTDDEEFDYVKIVMHYDDRKISLVTPVMDDPYNTGSVSYDFNVADDLVTYHDYQAKPNGLTVKDLKIPPKAKNKFGADIAEKMAWFVCYFFNNSPKPIFRIPPKGPKIYREHLDEYGTVPRHLEQMGMTQEMFYDWMDGGDLYNKADEIAKHYLVRKYGNTMAKKIIKKYEMDGSNAFVGIVLEEPGYQKYIDSL